MSQLIHDKQLINLFSKHGERLNSTKNSNVLFRFDMDLLHDDSAVYTEIGLVSCEIPVSYYVINDTNNTIIIDFNAVTDSVLTFPNGNYNAYEFATELLSIIETATGFSGFMTIEFHTITGKLEIQHTSTVNITSLTFTGGTAFTLSGFLGNFPISTTKGKLPFPLNLLGVNQLVIRSDNILTYNFNSGHSGYSNVLAGVEVNADPFGVVLFRNNSNVYSHLNSGSLKAFTIMIKDENDNFIDFQNTEWTLTLALKHYRRVPRISKLTFIELLKQPKQKETDDDDKLLLMS